MDIDIQNAVSNTFDLTYIKWLQRKCLCFSLTRGESSYVMMPSRTEGCKVRVWTVVSLQRQKKKDKMFTTEPLHKEETDLKNSEQKSIWTAKMAR